MHRAAGHVGIGFMRFVIIRGGWKLSRESRLERVDIRTRRPALWTCQRDVMIRPLGYDVRHKVTASVAERNVAMFPANIGQESVTFTMIIPRLSNDWESE